MKNINSRMKNTVKVCSVMAFGAVLSACSWQEVKNTFSDNGSGAATLVTEYDNLPASLVVCRSKQCAPTSANMSKEFLYNAYYSLMENNIGTNVLMCAADSVTHVCYEPFINFEVTAGVTPATVAIDAAHVVDVGMQKDNEKAVPVLNYSIYTNGVRARCNPSSAYVSIKDPSYMIIDNEQAICQFTATGSSSMSMVLTVDYIDLDYGIIGGYYSIGASGASYGGGKGYTLLRFEKPVNPDIYCQQKNASCAPFKPKLPDYNCCTGFNGKNAVAPCNRHCSGTNMNVSKSHRASDVNSVTPSPKPVVDSNVVNNPKPIPPAPKYIGDVNQGFGYPRPNDDYDAPFAERQVPRAIQWMDDVEHMHRDAAYSETGRNVVYADPNNQKDLVVISPVPHK